MGLAEDTNNSSDGIAGDSNIVHVSNDTSGKIRKSKSFTGCFTCRSRKIKCDLEKPQCKTCIKAGLICSGYDIKLKWSKPVEFKMKNGQYSSAQAVFKNGASDEDKAPTYDFFQRRKVGFVIWDSKRNSLPYETYADIDTDLNALHAKTVEALHGNETETLGPFGVFSSEPRFEKAMHASSSDLPRKRRHLQSHRFRTANHPTSRSISGLNDPQYLPPTPSINRAPEQAPVTVANDHFWLSNELRDDAMLTAAALNGDMQLLDFSVQNTPTDGAIYDPAAPSELNLPASANQFSSRLFDTNQNDFLNLVFHRNNIGHLTPKVDDVSVGAHHSPMSMSNLLNGPYPSAGLLFNSTSRSPDYLNYNGHHYNDPYLLSDTLEISLHASTSAAHNDDEHTDMADDGEAATTCMPSLIMTIVGDAAPSKLDFDLCAPSDASASPAMGFPTSALQVQPLTRYLLNYYFTQVADLMTVIPLTENPWKTIYFPRALMAIGELLALGKTSTAKNALLNGLLAVSAFNLQSKFPKHSQSMKFYLNLGIRLRNQASLFVKHLLSNKSDSKTGVEHCVVNEKYKDVLCAVMTMISVDLVWGTMQDINFYIKWCGRVIRAKMAHKKKLSSKARILHRVFLSLKLIQDSTCLDYKTIKIEIESTSNSNNVNGDMFGNAGLPLPTTGLSAPNAKVSNPSPAFMDKKLINATKYDENFATDALYGLPNSLILYFSSTVELLRTKIYRKEKFLEQPDDYTMSVNELNKKLVNWKLDWSLFEQDKNDEPERPSLDVDPDVKEATPSELQSIIEGEPSSQKKFLSPMHEAIYHHIMSFYYALTIYFNEFIKEFPPSKLQLKVAKTLHHLNAIQRLIAKKEAAMIPLFWQGFIAGCEATSVELQKEFNKWGADIAQYLGSYWGARQIMLEVWRRKRMNEARDSWVNVIQDWEMNLMLN